MGKVYFAVLPSKLLGKIFVASTEKGVCRLDFRTSEKKFLKELKKDSCRRDREEPPHESEGPVSAQEVC